MVGLYISCNCFFDIITPGENKDLNKWLLKTFLLQMHLKIVILVLDGIMSEECYFFFTEEAKYNSEKLLTRLC